MVTGLFHIRLNTSEDNKDKGFFALMTSGAAVMCLEDEEYIVDENTLKILKEKDIKHELVEEENQKVVRNKQGTENNATEVEI